MTSSIPWFYCPETCFTLLEPASLLPAFKRIIIPDIEHLQSCCSPKACSCSPPAGCNCLRSPTSHHGTSSLAWRTPIEHTLDSSERCTASLTCLTSTNPPLKCISSRFSWPLFPSFPLSDRDSPMQTDPSKPATLFQLGRSKCHLPYTYP